MANIVDIVIRGIDKTKQGLTQPIRNLDDLGAAASRIAPVMKLAAAATAGAFAYMVKQSIDAGDELAKLSQKTGIAVEALAGYKHGAELAGTSLEGMSSGLKLLSKNMYDAAAGTGEAKDAFLAMGIDVKDTEGKLKSAEDILLEVSDKFAQYEDGAAKAALAQRIFGKSGTEMIPFLNQGAEGIRKNREEAEKLGLVMSTDAAKASEEFNDNMSRLKSVLSGVATSFASQVLPALVDGTAALVGWANESKIAETAGAAFAGGLKLLASTGIVIATAFSAAGTAIGGLASILATAVNEGIGAAWDQAKLVYADLGEKLDSATQKMAALEGSAKGAGAAVRDVVSAAGGGIAPPTMAEKGTGGKGKSAAEASISDSEMIQNSLGLFLEAEQMKTEALLEENQKRIEAYNAFYEAGKEQSTNELGLFLAAQEAETNALLEAQDERVKLSKGEEKRFDTLGDAVSSSFGMMATAMTDLQTVASSSSSGLFAVYKAFSIAEALVSTYAGAARALKDFPYPISIAVAGIVTAAGLARVAAIASMQPAGAAHGGLEYVPQESTYLLTRGERVLSPRQNEDLTEFLDHGGSGGGQTIELYLDGRVLARWINENATRYGRINLRPA